MELTHEFTVPAHVDRAWEVLTDVERIAPCMPGAELTEVDGDTYHGMVKVKVGPITVQYKGTASFVERDEAAHRVVLKAAGRDARGQGNAAATVTALMTSQGDSTTVSISTDLSVSGKVAQFGRGVMSDVSAKLLEQFVHNIEADLLAPAGGEGAAPAEGAAAPATRPVAAAGEPVRLVGMTLTSVMSRLGQAVAGVMRRLIGRGASWAACGERRSGDEPQPERGPDQPHAVRPALRWCEIGDHGLRRGDVGAGDPRRDPRGEKHGQRVRGGDELARVPEGHAGGERERVQHEQRGRGERRPRHREQGIERLRPDVHK